MTCTSLAASLAASLATMGTTTLATNEFRCRGNRHAVFFEWTSGKSEGGKRTKKSSSRRIYIQRNRGSLRFRFKIMVANTASFCGVREPQPFWRQRTMYCQHGPERVAPEDFSKQKTTVRQREHPVGSGVASQRFSPTADTLQNEVPRVLRPITSELGSKRKHQTVLPDSKLRMSTWHGSGNVMRSTF